MSEPGQGTGPGTGPGRIAGVEDRSVGFLDYAVVVWRYWWLVLGVCVGTVAVTWVVTVRMPKIYAATATVIAPREGASPLSGLLGMAQRGSGVLGVARRGGGVLGLARPCSGLLGGVAGGRNWG